jgi:titin
MAAAADATIKNGVHSNNAGAGIDLSGTNGTLVIGNYVGVTADGVTNGANGRSGIRILTNGSNNTIGGVGAAARNIISGNTGDGVVLSGPGGSGVSRNVVTGNYIGLDKNGNKQGNTRYGVNINGGASDNTIGGTTAGAGDVISGNGSDGVNISNAGTSNNVIAGDLIGTDPTGMAAISNGGAGVYIDRATNNTVGALATGANPMLNVISGNNGSGVDIAGGSNNQVINCYIGTDKTGAAALANLEDGVRLEAARNDPTVTSHDNTIGGLAMDASRNVISGNGWYGVEMIGHSNHNVVEGNYIGTDLTGTKALGNSYDGVYLEIGSDSNTIGGTIAAAGNVISANGTDPTSDGYGVYINSNSNFVDYNFIGLDKNGNIVPALKNRVGAIYVNPASTGNTIGTNNKTQ